MTLHLPSGPFLLYSGSSVAAIGHAIDLTRHRTGPTADRLRLVVLQTPLDCPSPDEVAVLVRQFEDHGVSVEAVDPGLQTRDDAFRADLIEALTRADVILTTGGNPIRMADILRGSPALDALREASERGTIIGGGSAGAMVFGHGMLDGPARDPFPQSVPLLGLLPNLVIAPHFGNYPIGPWRDAFPGRPVLGLPDDAAVLAMAEGTRMRSVGDIACIVLEPDGSSTPIAPGESWPNPNQPVSGTPV